MGLLGIVSLCEWTLGWNLFRTTQLSVRINSAYPALRVVVIFWQIQQSQQHLVMHDTQSVKIHEMRRLARDLREYASRRSFSIYAEKTALMAMKIDRLGTTVETHGTVSQ
jgi:hypothetical protein